jgi:hypothetical protein
MSRTADNLATPPSVNKLDKLARGGYVAAVLFIAGGSGLVANAKLAPGGRILVSAGYIVLGLLLVVLIIMQSMLWQSRAALSRYWRRVRRAVLS